MSGRKGQTKFIPGLSHDFRKSLNYGAGNEARTRDLNLGKITSQRPYPIVDIENFHFCLPNGKINSERKAVKTHDSLPRGADRLGATNGGESTAATNLPRTYWGSECPAAACPAGNSHEHFTPASKDGCTLQRAGRRLATDIWHSWVKQASPQNAC